MIYPRKIRLKLQAKTDAYFYNAQANLTDGNHLIQHLQSNSLAPTVSNRVHQIIQQCSSQEICSIAYTLIWINGYMDYRWARYTAKFASWKIPKLTLYHQYSPLPRPGLISSWLLPFLGSSRSFYVFCHYHQLADNYRPVIFFRSVIKLQRINIEHNISTIKMIKLDDDENAWKLPNRVNKKYKDEYFNSIISTQKAAIRWDKIYVYLLKYSPFI